MKILCIGNSFSQDATRYLYGIARADGVNIKVVNLYIGGCSLEKHYRNMMGEKRDYALEINGMSSTGFFTTIKEALLSDSWDVVTLQQQSSASADYETFEPYLEHLVAYVRQMVPKARLMLHQTWGYREGSERLFQYGYQHHEEMYARVRDSYQRAGQTYGMERIPSGEGVRLANQEGVERLYRDDYHMSRGFGRYLLGLIFYRCLTQKDLAENPFRDFDEPLSEEEIAMAKALALRAVDETPKRVS